MFCNHHQNNNKKKRVKLIEYLKKKLESNGLLFLQETHSVFNDENAWADHFKGEVFFLMVHPTPVITCLGSKSLAVKNKRNDGPGRILILDITIDNTDYILRNIYMVQCKHWN